MAWLSSSITAMSTVQDMVSAPLLKSRTKIMRTQVQAAEEQWVSRGESQVLEHRRRHMTAGLSHNDLFYSQNTHTLHHYVYISTYPQLDKFTKSENKLQTFAHHINTFYSITSKKKLHQLLFKHVVVWITIWTSISGSIVFRRARIWSLYLVNMCSSWYWQKHKHNRLLQSFIAFFTWIT